VSAKPAWQQEWEQLVKDAQKEGRLVLYCSTGGEFRSALVETVKPITEFISGQTVAVDGGMTFI